MQHLSVEQLKRFSLTPPFEIDKDFTIENWPYDLCNKLYTCVGRNDGYGGAEQEKERKAGMEVAGLCKGRLKERKKHLSGNGACVRPGWWGAARTVGHTQERAKAYSGKENIDYCSFFIGG